MHKKISIANSEQMMARTFFIYLITLEVFGEVIINLNLLNLCDCEQLIYESECKMKKCQWSNDGICTTIPCEELLDRNSCKANYQCAWYQDKCSVFTKCSSYEVDSTIDCENLSMTCYWSTFNKCQDHQPSFSCQELQNLNCDTGKEGKCIKTQGICKEFTTCQEAVNDEKYCISAFPACYSTYVDGKHYCPSIMTCNDQTEFGCDIAKKKISGDEYTVCQQESDEKCGDWDISTSNLETCITKTHNTFHWVDNKCQKCQQTPPSLGIMISYLVVFILME